MNDSIKEYGLERLEGLAGTYGCDLHNAIFNSDYFIVGTWNAKQWLEEYGVFKAIGLVKAYEEMNFGEILTDLSNPEKLANMTAFILGEEWLMQSDTLRLNWDSRLSEDDINEIKTELE